MFSHSTVYMYMGAPTAGIFNSEGIYHNITFHAGG